MLLAKYRPLYELSNVFDSFGSLFPAFYESNYGYSEEDESSATYFIDLPGVKKEDIQIDIQKSILSLAATRKTGKKELKYSQSFSLPRGVDFDSIEGKLEDGVLAIKLQKIKKEIPKKITIT